MIPSSGFRMIFLLCAVAALVISTSMPAASAGDDFRGQLGWMVSSGGCRGTIAECLTMEGLGEFELDSESNRRVLATSRYISYGALRRNSVPCSRRGASYYNCRPGGQANPYTRGCSRITRCRG